MQFELDLLREHVCPMPEDSDGRDAAKELRKIVREATDRTIHEALLVSSRQSLALFSAGTMVAVATTLLTLRQEPEVEDFVYAAKELIEDARQVMDKGLHQNEMKDVKIAAVMLEIVTRGICALMDIPYEELFKELHRVRLAGEDPDIEKLVPIKL